MTSVVTALILKGKNNLFYLNQYPNVVAALILKGKNNV